MRKNMLLPYRKAKIFKAGPLLLANRQTRQSPQVVGQDDTRGERLGARPDLSRTYFEVGKRLLEPQSKHKELNGIDPKGYLEKS